MDQKITVEYRYSPTHCIPVVHGMVVTTLAEPSPNQITVHLYSEFPGLPSSFVIDEEHSEGPVSNVVKEVQATLVLPLDTARVMSRVFNNAVEQAEKANLEEGSEDDS